MRKRLWWVLAMVVVVAAGWWLGSVDVLALLRRMHGVG